MGIADFGLRIGQTRMKAEGRWGLRIADCGVPSRGGVFCWLNDRGRLYCAPGRGSGCSGEQVKSAVLATVRAFVQRVVPCPGARAERIKDPGALCPAVHNRGPTW